jgi:hypothetical protein
MLLAVNADTVCQFLAWYKANTHTAISAARDPIASRSPGY